MKSVRMLLIMSIILQAINIALTMSRPCDDITTGTEDGMTHEGLALEAD